MSSNFDRISKVALNRECVRLMVRIMRMWVVPAFNNPNQNSSLEMILLDQWGEKIQATVRKPLLYKFAPLLEEGCVYKMVYFGVVPNAGHYRATYHELKLIFLFKTTVVKKESDCIPMLGLSLVPFNEVLTYGDNYEHLIDVMGVLTLVMPERQYEKDGKVTTMVVMELTDPHGKLECALFGEYVDQLREFVRQGGNVQVVVVVQLARVKMFKGKTVIQNSVNATKLLFNPDIPEAITFRNSIAEHGVIDVEPLAMVLDNSREGMECDFMKLHPKKSISELHDIKEDGMFVVLGKIVEIFKDGPWFYLACKCNRSVTLQSNVHYCESCQIPVLQVSPRYKLKIEVVDELGAAVFILFDRDVTLLLSKTCDDLLTESIEVIGGEGYPALIDSLVGQRMLFKVETKLEQSVLYEGSYPVRRVCVDEDIIAMFDLPGSDLTPTKAVFAPPFPSVAIDAKDLEKSFTQAESDLLVNVVLLGEDEIGCGPKCTPAKRKLDGGCFSSKVSCVGAIVDLDAVDEVGDDVEPAFKLVPVKIEKE